MTESVGHVSDGVTEQVHQPVILHITQSRDIGNNVMQALDLDEAAKDFINAGLAGPIESIDGGSVHWFLSTSGIPLALDFDPDVDIIQLEPHQILDPSVIKVKLVTNSGKESFQNRLESILDLDELNDVVLWFDTTRYGHYVAEMVSQCVSDLYDGIDVYRVLYPEDEVDEDGNVLEPEPEVGQFFTMIQQLYRDKFRVDAEDNIEFKRLAQSIMVEKELTLRKCWAISLYIQSACQRHERERESNATLCTHDKDPAKKVSIFGPYLLPIANLVYQRALLVDSQGSDISDRSKLQHYTQATLLHAMRLNRIGLPRNRKKDIETAVDNGFIARLPKSTASGAEEYLIPTKLGSEVCEWLESIGLMEAVWHSLVNEISDKVCLGVLDRMEGTMLALASVRHVLAQAQIKEENLKERLESI